MPVKTYPQINKESYNHSSRQFFAVVALLIFSSGLPNPLLHCTEVFCTNFGTLLLCLHSDANNASQCTQPSCMQKAWHVLELWFAPVPRLASSIVQQQIHATCALLPFCHHKRKLEHLATTTALDHCASWCTPVQTFYSGIHNGRYRLILWFKNKR